MVEAARPRVMFANVLEGGIAELWVHARGNRKIIPFTAKQIVHCCLAVASLLLLYPAITVKSLGSVVPLPKQCRKVVLWGRSLAMPLDNLSIASVDRP